MRKLLAVFLAGLMLFGLLACGSDGTTSSTPESQTTTTAANSAGSDVNNATSTTATSVTTSGRDRTSRTEATTTTIPALNYDTSNEKPITIDTSILYNEMHSESDPQAAAMKQAVLNAKDEVKPSKTGTTYYVSFKGNDKNDGKSMATAWRTAQRVREEADKFKSGDVVLFERGGVYRGTIQAM